MIDDSNTKQEAELVPLQPFPREGLVRLKTILLYLPISASTWWSWVATGRAPVPIRLGSRTTCWAAREILRMIEGQDK